MSDASPSPGPAGAPGGCCPPSQRRSLWCGSLCDVGAAESLLVMEGGSAAARMSSFITLTGG